MAVTNPLSGLIEGLLQGHQIATQLHRQAQEDQAFKTRQALDNENLTMQQIMNRQKLDEISRPALNGTVQESFNAALPGGGLPQNVDQALGPAPAQPVTYARPIDKSRRIKGADGEERELLTPEEQIQRRTQQQITANDALELAKGEAAQRVRASVLKMRGVAVPDDIAKTLRLQPGTLVLPEEVPGLAQHAQQVLKEGFLNVPANGTVLALPGAAGADSTAATPGTPGGLAVVGKGADVAGDNRKSREKIAQEANKTRKDIADESNATRRDVAAGNQDAENKRAGERNQTTITAAGIRRDTPTAGQGAVESRFEQRRKDQATKDMRAVQASEDKIHADRLTIGEQLKDPNLKPEQRTALQAKLKTSAFQVQSYQTRKAAIAGATAPPKDIQDKIAEGQSATGPDGHTWMKKDGIVYFVQ